MAPLTNVEGGSFFILSWQINLRKFADKHLKNEAKKDNVQQNFLSEIGTIDERF